VRKLLLIEVPAMSHRLERASDFAEADARSVFTSWRSLLSEIPVHVSRSRMGGGPRRTPRARRRAKGVYRKSFAVEVIIVGILGGTVLICAAMLVPIVWTAVSEGIFGANLEQRRLLPATDSQDGARTNSPSGVVAPGRGRPAK
jgi:hypothetical protein